MTPRSLAWIAGAVGGLLVGDNRDVDAVATDTRALPQAGAPLFVALQGEQFDGHDHVAHAVAGGCVAALVARRVDATVPQVVVANTERALADFATAVQRERTTRVLALTGSNGKTSVKTLLYSILQQLGGAYANPGNHNNEIGLPLAVLAAPDDARFAVYEMGAGKPGDIAYLAAIARPDVALVNNIAPAHLERMGSLLGVAQTKGAIYEALPDDGVAVVNADDSFAPLFETLIGARRCVRFGLEASAEYRARDITLDAQGSRFTLITPEAETSITLPMPGRHNVRNALAAAAMAQAVGARVEQIKAGLESTMPVAGRLRSHRLNNDVVLIDDSYNANPGSLAAAIDTLVATAPRAWLVLGDMRELGADEAALHAEAGRRAKAAGIERLYVLGALSAHAAQAFGEGARVFESHAALALALQQDLVGGVVVLVKGSRGSAMDRIVQTLLRECSSHDMGGTDAA